MSRKKGILNGIVIRSKINDMPLYFKLILIFGVSLAAEFLVAMLLMGFIGSRYNELLYEQTENAMSFFSGNLENALKEIEDLSTDTITDPVIQAEMEAISKTSRSEYLYLVAQNRLEDKLIHNFYGESNLITMSLIQNNKLIVSVGKSTSSDVYDSLGLLDDTCTLGDKEWRCIPEDYSLLYIRKIRKIEKLSLRELGYLVIRIDFDKMISKSINARYRDDKIHFLHIRSEDETLYSTLTDANLAERGNWKNGYRIIDIDKNKLFVTYSRIKNYGWDIFYGIPYSRIFHSMTAVWIVTIAILSLIVLLVCILCNHAISQILWHFDYLERKIKRFKVKREPVFEPEVYDYRKRHDEIALIHRSFDDMTLEITNLIQENYEKQIVIQDARIKILEQQMNPHFLYNMLQMIEWHAKLSDRETTASIVNTLGSFLHNTMEETPERIPLRKELEIVHDYITLIQARYEDEVSFSVEIAEEYMDTVILKMTIQPLVENAVYYGISEGDGNVQVMIGARLEGNVLAIYVCNTGSEIDEHILEHLESGEAIANGNGIGLRNIQERLRLTYGADYGLEFTSGNQMTTVTVRIPL